MTVRFGWYFFHNSLTDKEHANVRPQVFLCTPLGCLSSGIHKNEKQKNIFEQKPVCKMAIIEPLDRRLLDAYVDDQFHAFLRQGPVSGR